MGAYLEWMSAYIKLGNRQKSATLLNACPAKVRTIQGTKYRKVNSTKLWRLTADICISVTTTGGGLLDSLL
jgi:hypothetical protein